MSRRHPRWPVAGFTSVSRLTRWARWNRFAALASVVVMSLGAMCKSAPLSASGGRWIHPELGYAVDAPAVSPLEWQPTHREGVDLAYRKRDGSSLTLMSDCSRGPAHPSLLARQLLIGTPERELLESYPVALGSDPGWKLVFRTPADGRVVTVSAVTVASGKCTFDWLWVAADPADLSDAAEAGWFDEWWASFDRDGGER